MLLDDASKMVGRGHECSGEGTHKLVSTSLE